MDVRDLLDRYQATGDEEVFLAARAAYEAVLPDTRDAETVYDYGFLLECHARNLMRQATTQYQRATELDPAWDKVRYQLIHAKAALFEPHEAIAEHRRRLAEAPHDVREHRFLAYALLVAHEYQPATEVVAAGLRLAGEDRKLIEFRGDVRAGLGDAAGALVDWRRAVELDPTDIAPWYSAAYLLERENRIGEAIGVWRQILDWNQVRDNAIDVDMATRELDRLHTQPAGDTGDAPTG